VQTEAPKRTEVQRYLAGKFEAALKVSHEEIDAALSPADKATVDRLTQEIAKLNAGRKHGHNSRSTTSGRRRLPLAAKPDRPDRKFRRASCTCWRKLKRNAHRVPSLSQHASGRRLFSPVG
jgi:hypothetical protein